MLSLTLLVLSTLLPTAPDDEAAVRAQMPTYPLTTCVVGGDPLDDSAVNLVHEGRLVRLCCNDCKQTFAAEPAKYLMQIDAAVVREQLPTYPLERCVLKGEPLDAKAVNVVVGTRLVRVCCKNCERVVRGDPTKALAALDEAYVRALLPKYALKTCLVKGEPLGPDAQNLIYGNELVRLCCKSCKTEFAQTPKLFVDKLHAAAVKPAARQPAEGARQPAERKPADGGAEGGSGG